jgi:DNA polymerase III epsilon subunit-like protein
MASRFDRPLRTASLRFVDLETTGLRPDRGARITEMAVVDEGGVRYDWTSSHDPPRDEAVAAQLPQLVAHLDDGIVVGHNLSFDVRFVTYEAERLGLDGIDVCFIDTLGLARRVLARAGSYRLGAVLAAVGAAPEEELHTAVGDALATRTLFWRLVERGGLGTLADAGAKRLRWHGR